MKAGIFYGKVIIVDHGKLYVIKSVFFYRLWWVKYSFSLASFSSCQAVFDIALLSGIVEAGGACGRRAPKISLEQAPQ